MIYALDTNTISFLLRAKQNQEVVARFTAEINRGNDYVIPPLCYYEITWYLIRKKALVQLRLFHDLYQNAFVKTCMSEEDLLLAAQIRASLEEHGVLISDADILIAAYCITNNYTLITDNTNEFKRIEKLKFENWKK